MTVRAWLTTEVLPGRASMKTANKKKRLLEDFDYVHDPVIERPQWVSILLTLRLLLSKAWQEAITSLSHHMSILPLRLQGRCLFRFAKFNYKYQLQALPYCPAEDRARIQRLLRKHAVRFAKFQLLHLRAMQTLTLLACAPYFYLFLVQSHQDWRAGPGLSFVVVLITAHIVHSERDHITAARLLLIAAVTSAIGVLLISC